MSANPAKDVIEVDNVIAEATPSPAYSMKGWTNATWLKRQAPAIKQILTIIVGVVTAWVQVVNFPSWATAFIPVITALVSLGSRYLMDRFDYWVTENPGTDTPAA